MNKTLLSSLLFSLCFPLLAAERHCLTAGPSSGQTLTWIQSVNTDSQSAARRLNEQLPNIKIAEENTGPDIQFVRKPIAPGDCVLSRAGETQTLKVEGKGDTALLPIVFLRKNDAAKLFGFVAPETFAKLSAEPRYEELTAESLLAYRGHHRDLTLLYVLCPADRLSACTLKIRHKGKWIKKTFKVLAKAQHRQRIALSGDTPQGIYHFWATMFENDVGFGGLPRIDLDASLPPLNAYPYEMNKYVLAEMIPPAAMNDYWVNEWPLAYRLGRVHLRLHGSHDPNRPTEGCLNCGVKTGEILQTLVELGALDKSQILPRPPDDPKTLGWKVAPGLGKTFVVVKDLP